MPRTTPSQPIPTLHLPELHEWVAQRIGLLTRQGIRLKATFLGRYLDVSFFHRSHRHERPLAAPILRAERGAAIHQFLFASSFSVGPLRDGLGGSTGDYQKYLRLFWDFPEWFGYRRGDASMTGKGVRRGYTKPYVLKPSVVTELTRIWKNDGPGIVVDSRTGKILRARDLPANGIVQSSYSMLHVPALIRLNRDDLDHTIAQEEARGGLDGDKVPLRDRRQFVISLRELYRARKWVHSLGGIPNLYRDYRGRNPTRDNGRLWGIGQLHFQRVSRGARPLILRGTKWRDYDFEACHPTIFVALAAAHSVPASLMADYVKHRTEWRRRLADDLEIPEPKVKRLMNSMLYGLPITTWPQSAIVKQVGRDGAQRLRDYKPFRALLDEIKAVATVIVQHHTEGRYVVNVIGKKRRRYRRKTQNMSRKHRARGEFKRKLLSHVLTGVEAWALNVVACDDSQLKIIMHDGFITAGERDLQECNRRVVQEALAQFRFTIPLSLDLKQQFI